MSYKGHFMENQIDFIQIEKDHTEHCQEAQRLWIPFIRELRLHEGTHQTDEEYTDCWERGMEPSWDFTSILSFAAKDLEKHSAGTSRQYSTMMAQEKCTFVPTLSLENRSGRRMVTRTAENLIRMTINLSISSICLNQRTI